MNTHPYIRYAQFRSLAKRVSKRFAIPYSRSLEMLSRGIGYKDLHHLQSLLSEPLADGGVHRPRAVFGHWRKQMLATFGDDLGELFSEAELLIWCRRVHGRLEGDSPSSDTDSHIDEDTHSEA